jgi:hypothetical protein
MVKVAAFGDAKQVPIAPSTESSSSHNSHVTSPAHGSYDDHPFKDNATAQYWRDVYEAAQYEGRPHLDPIYT